MKFALASFATTLDAALVEKGKKWYSEGMVQHVQNANECVWNADIIGPNKQFKVQIEIVGKEVRHVFCNCSPKLCSHIVALLFELSEKDYPTEKYYAGTEKKVTKQGEVKVVDSPLTKILQNIDEGDLKRFVKKYATNNKEFLDHFLSEFGEIDIESHVARYGKIIKSTSKFDDISAAMDGTRRVIKDAQKNLSNENYEMVLAACKAVQAEWARYVYTIKHAGYVFNDSMKLLQELAKCQDLTDSLKTALFNHLFQLYKSSEIEDYQDGGWWTDAFVTFAASKAHLQRVLAMMETKLKTASDYHKSDFLEHKEQIKDAIKYY